MCDKIVFEGEVDFEKDEGGYSLQAEVYLEGEDPSFDAGLWIRLMSWDESGEHLAAVSLEGKRVRITLEVVKD